MADESGRMLVIHESTSIITDTAQSVEQVWERNLLKHVLDYFLLNLATKLVLMTKKHAVATGSPSTKSHKWTCHD